MHPPPNQTTPQRPRAIWLALGIALGANATPAFAAGNVFDLNAGKAASAAASVNLGSTKLTLGLDALSAEYQAYQQAAAEAVANSTEAPGSFTTTATMAMVVGDMVVVDAVAAGDPEALAADLVAIGAEVTAAVGRMVSARLPMDQIPALESMDTLQFARPAIAFTRTGSVTSQGDPAQRSDQARTNFSIDGTGSIVGVLSDSFDCSGNGSYATDIGTGDLPAGINILDDSSSSCTDEGRAMAQIVYDVAPGAGQAFHTAFTGEAAFAQGILDLASAGATIIVDDVSYFAEPMFQDGVIAQAVDTVDATGVSYFSSAGNSDRQAYQATFDDSGITGNGGGTEHDFDPGLGVDTRLAISQNAATTYALQWQEPFFTVSGAPGAATNLNLCFYSGGSFLFCTSTNNIGGDPVDIGGLNGTGAVEIAIERVAGPVPGLVKIAAFGNISFNDAYAGTSAGTVYGHSNAANANSVGASAYFNTPAFGKTPPVLNYYSSAGNTPIRFDTSGNPVNITRDKPDFTAPDGGNNTFFGSDFEPDGFPNFFGTSAAAPHAAGVAALMREVDVTLSPADITSVLQNTAIDILQTETGGFGGPLVNIGVGYDNDSGSGLIDADAAVATVVPPSADLSIAKSDDIDPIIAGSQLTYSVTVSNAGPSAATNVVVTDTLPAGVTFVSTSGCTEDPNGVAICSLSDIASGVNASYTIVVDVDAGTTGTITNSASVSSDTDDPDTNNNSTTEDTQVNLFGDQDGDGCIGRNDVIIVIGDVRSGSTDLATQDINSDGVVNRADGRATVQIYTNPNGVCP